MIILIAELKKKKNYITLKEFTMQAITMTTEILELIA